MLSSLQIGIRALAAERHIFWAVVAPLDQPFLSAGLIQRLVATAIAPPRPPAAVVPATPAMERTGTWGLPWCSGGASSRRCWNFREPGRRKGKAGTGAPAASSRGTART